MENHRLCAQTDPTEGCHRGHDFLNVLCSDEAFHHVFDGYALRGRSEGLYRLTDRRIEECCAGRSIICRGVDGAEILWAVQSSDRWVVTALMDFIRRADAPGDFAATFLANDLHRALGWVDILARLYAKAVAE